MAVVTITALLTAPFSYAADDEIGIPEVSLDGIGVGVNRFDAAFEGRVKKTQHLDVAIENDHAGTQADGHLRRVEAHHAAADHGHAFADRDRHITLNQASHGRL